VKIAILGWGSLITNPGSLRLAEPFRPGGPRLLLEFSHVSLDGRLTLIIDEVNGAWCPSWFAVSAHTEIKPAILDLQARENLKFASRVGWLECRMSHNHARWCANPRSWKLAPQSSKATLIWAATHDFDAVIWTASYSNFHLKGKAGEPFSLGAVQRYLDRLTPGYRVVARQYAQGCPSEICTPARTIIESQLSTNQQHEIQFKAQEAPVDPPPS
jgi:hypothetical protein